MFERMKEKRETARAKAPKTKLVLMDLNPPESLSDPRLITGTYLEALGKVIPIMSQPDQAFALVAVVDNPGATPGFYQLVGATEDEEYYVFIGAIRNWRDKMAVLLGYDLDDTTLPQPLSQSSPALQTLRFVADDGAHPAIVKRARALYNQVLTSLVSAKIELTRSNVAGAMRQIGLEVTIGGRHIAIHTPPLKDEVEHALFALLEPLFIDGFKPGERVAIITGNFGDWK